MSDVNNTQSGTGGKGGGGGSAAGTGASGGVVSGGAGGSAPACMGIPPAPAGTPGTQATVFAVTTWNFGGTTDADWHAFTLNLDGAEKSLCKPLGMVLPAPGPCGGDNSFGQQAGDSLVKSSTVELMEGRSRPLLAFALPEVSGPAPGGYYVSVDQPSLPVPVLDAVFQPWGFSTGDDGKSPGFLWNESYLVANTLVAKRTGATVIPLFAFKQPWTLPLREATLVAQLSSDRTTLTGFITGTARVVDLNATPWPAPNGCKSVDWQQLADLGPPGAACDAVSFGFAFTGTRITLGLEVPGIPGNPCIQN